MMERLTEQGYVYHECDFMDSGVSESMNRLAAYEDTGLTPEEVAKAMEDCGDTVAQSQWAIKLLKSIGGEERANQLIQAQQDGRLAVLTCKVETK